MRRCAISLLVLLLASAALAGLNPDVRIYLDFDPPNGVTRIDPEPYSLFDVYVVLDCLGAGGGLLATALALERTLEGGPVEQQNLLEGATGAMSRTRSGGGCSSLQPWSVSIQTRMAWSSRGACGTST